MRPLGIPVMQYDPKAQALLKLALEPEWEAYFEPLIRRLSPRAMHS